jgi:hypothetical protein
MRPARAAVLRGKPATAAWPVAFRQSSVFRSVHDQVSRSGLGEKHSSIRRLLIPSKDFVKNFVKLCAERAAKRPLGSAYSVDNTRAPDATDRLLTEGL